VIFSVGLIHLLADKIKVLQTTSDFPLGLTLCALGILLKLGIETATVVFMSSISTPCPPKLAIADEEVAENFGIDGNLEVMYPGISRELPIHERKLGTPA
jgi:hypothetical protein